MDNDKMELELREMKLEMDAMNICGYNTNISFSSSKNYLLRNGWDASYTAQTQLEKLMEDREDNH